MSVDHKILISVQGRNCLSLNGDYCDDNAFFLQPASGGLTLYNKNKKNIYYNYYLQTQSQNKTDCQFEEKNKIIFVNK